MIAIRLQAWTGPECFRSSSSRFEGNQHMEVVRLLVLRNGSHYSSGNTLGINFCWRLSRGRLYVWYIFFQPSSPRVWRVTINTTIVSDIAQCCGRIIQDTCKIMGYSFKSCHFRCPYINE
jgi:hypothetical protein